VLEKCPNCERLYHTSVEHECPDPYPLDLAKSLVEFYSRSGIPCHPNTKARCVLAYKKAGLA